LDWMSGALKASVATQKVVVTHHCPTLRKEFNNYHGGALNSAFQVDVDAFIEASDVDYWVYGHTHYAGGLGTKIGETTLLCNQLGYVFQNEHLDFDGKACFEL
ncbi:MAG: metallophosphoesterase, partial [Bacteroidales bacterium]|nr:metallophosphoesterase [Bacteroidales bacterium]